jgi:SPP1 family phage portal protein
MESDNEQPLNFKDNRVLNFADTSSKAEYLIKNINDSALENYKDRLNNDIHRFSNVVNMSDQNFGGNLTGIAIKHKLTGMEYITGIKETKFKKGLMRRIELATTVLNIKTSDVYLYAEIKPVFTRNMPTNEGELTNLAKSLVGIVSDQTVLSMLPQVDDVVAEMEMIAKEKENTLDNYNDLGVING